MSMSTARIRAIAKKEMRDYRRNRYIAGTMIVMPLIFIVIPIVELVSIRPVGSSSALNAETGVFLLYMLLIPTIVPTAIASYAVVGEREQGTLEPVLTTPIRREEFLLGKALAALVPALAISYGAFGAVLACVALFSHPGVASEVFQGSRLMVQLIFTPLLAAWAIWVGIAVSTRTSDIRVAGQLSILGSLPPLVVAVLIGFGAIPRTLGIALGFAAVLLTVDVLGWRLVAGLFDRERLVTGAKSPRGSFRGRRVKPGGRAFEPSSATLPGRGDLGGPTGAVASATFCLSRRWGGLIDYNRSWQIEIDGDVVASIAPRGTVEVPLTPGRHAVRVCLNRHLSPERTFEVSSGETVSFWCRAAMLWPRYLAALVKHDLWISLVRD